MFIFFLHLGTIRVKGVPMEGNCTTIQRRQTELCTRCGAVNEPPEGTHFFSGQGWKVGLSSSFEFHGSTGNGERTGDWKVGMKEK